jgi:hypothetical protein
VTDRFIFKDADFIRPEQGLCPLAEAARMIREGRVLLLAGAEDELARLPEGCWIGGTAGYFITPHGGTPAEGQIFYADFTCIATSASWRRFAGDDIHQIAEDYPENGFAILLLPGCSNLLGHVAGRIMEFNGLYNVPLMGWVSAVPLLGVPDNPPAARPKVFAGGPQAEDERAAVLYVSLPPHYFAQLHVANLFAPGDGPDIRFLPPGQPGDADCLIGGERGNLARYIADQGIDRRLPLVADHEGALLNVAILNADEQSGRTLFLAPVSPALTYRFAETILDYEAEFFRAAEEIALDQAAHACICVLHYYHAGLAGPERPHGVPWRGPAITAPVTFGQIAYTVLNQTLTCLSIARYGDGMEEFAP